MALMQNKTVLVTGSTDGIGKQTAFELTRMGARVIIHGRDAARVQKATDETNAASEGRSNEGIVCDFSSLKSVDAMAAEFVQRFPRLDVLINNAGVYMNERMLSADGYEMTFAVNHLAPFLLTLRLLDLLRASSPSRVINVSSVAHGRGNLDLTDLHHERHYDAYGAYAASKLANVLFSVELAARLNGSGVTSNSLHPGVITTKLLRTGFNMSGASLDTGAATSVFLASSPSVADTSGEYFAKSQVTSPSARAQVLELRQALWARSESLVEKALRS